MGVWISLEADSLRGESHHSGHEPGFMGFPAAVQRARTIGVGGDLSHAARVQLGRVETNITGRPGAHGATQRTGPGVPRCDVATAGRARSFASGSDRTIYRSE